MYVFKYKILFSYKQIRSNRVDSLLKKYVCRIHTRHVMSQTEMEIVKLDVYNIHIIIPNGIIELFYYNIIRSDYK